MRYRFKASPVRSSRWRSIASTAPGGAATSQPMPRRRSRPRSGATSQLFRTRRSGHDRRKTPENSYNTLIHVRQAPRVFPASTRRRRADIESRARCQVALHQLQSQLSPHDFGGALKALDRGAAVVRVEQAIDLRAASFHQLGHPLFGDLLFLHFASQLACYHSLDRRGGCFLADSGVVEPAFEARTYVRVFPCHDCNSLSLCLASVRSSVGVFCVFLIIACRAISM